jgi:3-methyladenine DNA glycosylase AlkD
MNELHREILGLIQEASGKPTQHTFLDSYLGNSNPRYPINAPRLRSIAKQWMRDHRELGADAFASLIGSLVKGVSSTEKVMAGILLDNATSAQKQFDPALFHVWLDHLTGWAEIDAVCTGRYCDSEIPANVSAWKKILLKLSQSENINKRRASLVFLCSPISHSDDPKLAEIALKNIDRLKKEKDIIITRAISWLLRSMIRYHRKAMSSYLTSNASTLPALAVRETKIKLKTGRKSTRKVGNK